LRRCNHPFGQRKNVAARRNYSKIGALGGLHRGTTVTDQELLRWINDEVANGRMSAVDRDDLIVQKRLFDGQRSRIERVHRGRVVGYAGNSEFIGDSVHDIIAQARLSVPKRIMYFEPIGFDLF
jgi:hypothetical protein